MKTFIIIAMTLACLALLAATAPANPLPNSTLDRDADGDSDLFDDPTKLFKRWMKKFPGAIEGLSQTEILKLFANFKKGIDRAKAENQDSDGDVEFNVDADIAVLSLEELNGLTLGDLPPGPDSLPLLKRAQFSQEEIAALPRVFDWRNSKKRVVAPVQFQGFKCGACWAFSTTAATEGAWAVAGHPFMKLSEQHLVSCKKSKYGRSGCWGGSWPDETMTWLKKIGGQAAAKYLPFDNTQTPKRVRRCPATIRGPRAKIQGFLQVRGHDQLKAALHKYGPLSVTIDVKHLFYYRRGIVRNGKKCSPAASQPQATIHAVTLTGWGYAGKNIPVWFIKNSWKKSWGVNGYVLLRRGKENTCGIYNKAFAAIA